MLDAVAALRRAEALLERLQGRRSDVETTQRYFAGEHPLKFMSAEWGKAHQERYRGFSDNWCGVVGSAPAERTEISGFRLGPDAEPMSADERVLWDDWDRADGPAQSSQGFHMATVSRRSFALVWGERDGTPLLTWEHPAQVIVDYDPERPQVRTAALKAWADDATEFMTLYLADEVWKWQRPSYRNADRDDSKLILPASLTGGGWAPRQGVSDDTWPIRNPLRRVPVVEFANRPQLGGRALSDIEGTMAMQDAINLLWAYLFNAADYASMPARVVMGQEPPKIPVLDDKGQKVGEKPIDIQELTKGRMLWLTGQATKINQWDAAKLDVFTDVVNIAVRHIAAQTSTPIYLVHGELGNVNGETLTGLDAPLVAKVRASHKFYRFPVRDVFALMALVRGNKGVADAAMTGDVQWANPEVRSDAQVADAALKDRQVGIPLQAVLEERYGYSQPKIDRILKMAEAENTVPYLAGQDAKQQEPTVEV